MNLDRTPMSKTYASRRLCPKPGRGRALLAVCLTLGMWMTSVTAYSAGLGFLKGAPVRYFSEKDWRLLKNASKRALENGRDGETIKWKNPHTGSSGAVTPTKTFEQEGSECRTLKIQNTAAGRTDEAAYDFCKQADGTWKIPP